MAKAQDLQTKFQKEIAPKLMQSLNLKNINSVPKITKVTVNVGFGGLITKGQKDFAFILENIEKITGQKPVVANARKSISNFKIREGMPIGSSVTLRGKRMYDLISKLVNIVFPRVRDFRGISTKAFDKQGNYSIGFREHTVFPEISPDDVMRLHGLQIVISTTANNKDEGLALLTELGFPFKKSN